MIAPSTGVRVFLACGYTDMRRGMQGLAMQVQQVLVKNPFEEGTVYAFRGPFDYPQIRTRTITSG